MASNTLDMSLEDVIKARGKTGGGARSSSAIASTGRRNRRGGVAKAAEGLDKKTVTTPSRTNADARGIAQQAAERKPRAEGAARGFMAAAKAAFAAAKATAIKAQPTPGSSAKSRQMAAALAGSGSRQSGRKDIAKSAAPKIAGGAVKGPQKTEDKLAMTLDDVIKTQVKPKGGAEAKLGVAREQERAQGRAGNDAAGKRGRRMRIVKLGQGRKPRRRAGAAAALVSTPAALVKSGVGRSRVSGKARAFSGMGGRASNRLGMTRNARRVAATASSSWGPAWRSNLPGGRGNSSWRRTSNTPDWDAHDRREPGGVGSRGDFASSMNQFGAGLGMKRMMAASLGRDAGKRMRLSAGGRDLLDEPWGSRGAAARLGGRGGPGSVLLGERLRETMSGFAALGAGSGRKTPFDADWGATPKGRAVQQAARESTRLGRPREAQIVGTQIRVMNVPRSLDCADIKEAFEDTGKVLKCEVERGVARVTFKNAADAKRAVNTFDRGELNGQTIFVTLAP